MTKAKTSKKNDKKPPASPNFEQTIELFSRLMEAALNSHYTEVRKAGSEFSRNLDVLGYGEQAKKLNALLKKKGVPLQASGQVERLPVDTKSRLPLVEEISWPAGPLFLNEDATDVFQRFITDAQNAYMLSERGLSSPLCMLLCGPPGTGKTLLASHVAAQLERPFYIARLDSVISSLLGETAKNIRAVFDFIPHKKAVLLLDEIDAVAKMRDDRHELGEIKRVVNTLIQGLDSIDNETVVIGATNHPHLLDQAIWRRFPYKIVLDNPDKDVREAMWSYFLFQDNDKEKVSKALSVISSGLSGAEIEEISLRTRRRSVLDNTDIDAAHICRSIMKNLNKTNGSALTGSSSITEDDERKNLTYFMCEEKGLTKVDASKLLGVTRQTVAADLKESSHGE